MCNGGQIILEIPRVKQQSRYYNFIEFKIRIKA